MNLSVVIATLKKQKAEYERHLQPINSALSVLENLSGVRKGRGGSAGQTILSPAARKRIAAAQKARWAKYRWQKQKQRA